LIIDYRLLIIDDLVEAAEANQKVKNQNCGVAARELFCRTAGSKSK